jgi:para-nitrobenzyl esterase
VLADQPAGIAGASPTIDGKFLTQSVITAFTNGQFNHVPVLEGANHDEWRLFVAILADLATGPVTPDTYGAFIQASLGVPAATVPLFEAQYPLANFASPDLALGALGSDGIFDCNARFAEQKLSQFVPTFAYQFNDPNAPERFLPPVSFPYASAHASEIQYLFDLPVTVPAPGLTPDQVKLSQAMVSYWTNFARTGEPGSRGGPSWNRFTTTNDTDQALVPPQPMSETNFATVHNCAFWDSIRQ